MNVFLIEDKKSTPLLLTDDKGYPVPSRSPIENPPVFDYISIDLISHYGTPRSKFENIVKPFIDFINLMAMELPREQHEQENVCVKNYKMIDNLFPPHVITPFLERWDNAGKQFVQDVDKHVRSFFANVGAELDRSINGESADEENDVGDNSL